MKSTLGTTTIKTTTFPPSFLALSVESSPLVIDPDKGFLIKPQPASPDVVYTLYLGGFFYTPLSAQRFSCLVLPWLNI